MITEFVTDSNILMKIFYIMPEKESGLFLQGAALLIIQYFQLFFHSRIAVQIRVGNEL